MTELSSAASRRLKQTHRSSVLLGDIERHVMREAMQSDRDMSYVHPSDMAKPDFCSRWAYYTVTGTEVTGTTANPSFQLQNVFAEGHTIHAKWQGWLQRMGVLWGRWECPGCGDEYFGFAGSGCAGCQTPPVYREVPLWSDKHMIKGHADGAVLCSDGKIRLIEIKSVGIGTVRMEAPNLFRRYSDGELTLDGLWRAINKPFPSHVRQGMIYLTLAPLTHEELAEVDEIVFLYEFKANQATKEFVVRLDPTMVADRLEDARSVAASVKTGRTPERPDWAEDPAVSTCKKCEYRETCWELKKESKSAEDPKKRTVVKRADGRRRKKVLGS